MIHREYLEADIIDYCNLKCNHCSHHSPYMDAGVYELDQFTNDVKNLAKVLHVDKFRILGGEPLLNHDLIKYIQVLRKYNLADNIGICTNGTLLNVVDEKLLAQMDFLDVSLYPNLRKPTREKVLGNIKRLLAIDETKITVEEWGYFRTTETLIENRDKKLVKNIWNACYVKSLAHAIYKGYYVRCTASQNKGKFLKKMGIKGIKNLLIIGKDGLNLNTPNLEEALINYIKSDTPLEACKWCLGISSKKTPHCQRDEQNQNRVQTQKELENTLDFSQNIKTRFQLKKIIKKGKCYKQ